MFKKNLLKIKEDLQSHRRDKVQLKAYYINTRLNKSLHTYYKTLNSSAYAVSVADPEQAMRGIQ